MNQFKWIGFIVFLMFVSSCQESKTKLKPVPKEMNSIQQDTVVPLPKNNGKAIEQKATADDDFLLKATVSRKDSSIWLAGNIRMDYRIFGYAAPDTLSEKLLLLSVFTNDVKDNPHHCKFGAYYDSPGMQDLSLKYTGRKGGFVQANLLRQQEVLQPVFFEKRWIEFD